MARQKAQNTYIGGMDRDTSINKYPNSKYFHSENFRINTSSGLSDGVLENIDGNKLVIQTTNNRKIIGIEEMNDYLYLFVTPTSEITDKDTHNAIDYIYRISIDEIKDASTPIVLSDLYYFNTPNGNLVYKGVLYFSVENKIKAVSRYESSSVQKLYWIDGYNSLKYINTVNSSTNNLESMDESRLSILPSIDNIPTINASVVSGGNLNTSTIEYFVQFYEKNGNESSIIGKSNLVYISKNADRGSDLDDVSNKAVSLSFDYDDSLFNRVRILAADYTTLSTTPNLRIVSEQELLNGTNVLVDTGESLGSEESAELNDVKLNIISNTIDIKDNILFTGNLKEEYFEITDEEFDARAYRFNPSRTANLWEYVDGVNWNTKSIDGSNPNWSSIPSNYDAINPSNFLRYDTSGVSGRDGYNAYEQFFQSDGSTIGGSGEYVSYKFTTELGDILDSGESAKSTDPVINGSKAKCYQRGEIYRFGIVFFDKSGRQSFTKWIGDIRIPFLNQYPATNGSAGIIYENLIYPEFKVELPQSVKDKISGYEIVRVERDSANRSILASGIISPTVSNQSGSLAGADYFMGTIAYQSNDSREYLSFGSIKDYFSPRLSYIGGSADGNYINQFLIEFASPEINFNKNINLSDGDFIGVEGIMSTPLQAEEESKGSHFLYSKYLTTKAFDDEKDRQFSDISDMKIISPKRWSDSTERIDGYNYLSHQKDVLDESQGCKAGTRLVCKLDSFFYRLDNSYYTSTDNYMIGQYKRDNSNQYGGGTYSSRLNESYIGCGYFTKVDGVYSDSTYRVIKNGDIFITMFEYLRGLGDSTHDSDNRMQEVVYFPIESTINTQLKSNELQSVLTTSDDYEIDSDFYFIQETVAQGIKDYPRDVGNKYAYPDDATDLYQYNSVYSREANLKNYFSSSFDFESTESFPYSIRHSEKKIDGEYTDSWLNFKSNNKNSIDSKYGELTKILTHNNHLYFIQPEAFGVASVNERSVIQDNNTTQLVLGTGAVLDRFDYISTNTGSSYIDSVIGVEGGIYFYDNISNKIVRYNKSLNYISDELNISSFLNNEGSPTNVITGYDHFNRDINFILKNDSSKLLTYNEYSNSFIGLQSYDPNITYNKNDYLLTSNSLEDLYIHNKGDKASFYGNISDSKLTLIINPNQDLINIFDLLDWLTIVSNSSDIEQQELTISTIRFYNSYQDSGTIDLSTNIAKRRFRTWRFNKLRDSLNKRFRDSYLKVDITFDNGDNNKILLYDIFTTYYPTNL